MPRIPASVEKLYTTATALRTLGPDGRLVTQVLAAVPPDGAGTLDGDLYLRGEGDPTFGPLDLQELAQQVGVGRRDADHRPRGRGRHGVRRAARAAVLGLSHIGLRRPAQRADA